MLATGIEIGTLCAYQIPSVMFGYYLQLINDVLPVFLCDSWSDPQLCYMLLLYYAYGSMTPI